MTNALYDNFDPSIIVGEEVLLVAHYDLDAVGSYYFAEKLFNVGKGTASGYAKILGNLQKHSADYDIVVFVDLSASDEVMDYAMANFKKVFYCDHHLDSERFHKLAKEHPNKFYYMFDHDRSATGLIYDKCKEVGVPISLAEKEAAKAIDAYDLWQTDNRWFKIGYHLNTLFWDRHFWSFKKVLERYGREKHVGKNMAELWHEDDIQFCKDKLAETVNYVTNEDNFTDVACGNIRALIYFFPEGKFYINDVLLNMKEHDLVVGFTMTGDGTARGSLRSNLEIDMNDVIKTVVSNDSIAFSGGGGHAKACGLEMKTSKVDVILEGVIDLLEVANDRAA